MELLIFFGEYDEILIKSSTFAAKIVRPDEEVHF